jgi:SAM-dependent methyltransferase
MRGLDWYHSIELEPGIWTPGKSFPPIALTRHILRGCGVENSVCLDIGAMDGLVGVLLKRRDARSVIACDRYDRRPQIEIVQQALNVDFLYLGGMNLAQVRAAAPHLIKDPFDLIVFSGVLYHMYDPMSALGVIRSMVRPGGIVVVETYAVLSEKMVGYFNAFGNIEQDCHNYWNFSVALLDYLLRYFRLKILVCAYWVVPNATSEDGAKVLRVCLPCEATEVSLADRDDAFMSVTHRDDDAEFPAWSNPASSVPMPYASPFQQSLARRGSGSIALYETIANTPPLAFSDANIKLEIGARC